MTDETKTDMKEHDAEVLAELMELQNKPVIPDCLRDCPKLGACCKSMFLTKLGRVFPSADNITEANQQLKDEGLPFEVIGYERNPEVTEANQHTSRYNWRMGCLAQLPDGLCGMYDNKPELCRNYYVGKDGLCVLHPNHEAAFAALTVYPLTDLPDGSFKSDVNRTGVIDGK